MTIRGLLSALTVVFASATAAAESNLMQEKAAALNAQSVKVLGVSLNALRYLIDADANSYLHLGYLEQSGGRRFIRELESKGYVETQVLQGLPDGTQRAETFLRVIPVGEGVELRRAINNLQREQ